MPAPCRAAWARAVTGPWIEPVSSGRPGAPGQALLLEEAIALALLGTRSPLPLTSWAVPPAQTWPSVGKKVFNSPRVPPMGHLQAGMAKTHHVYPPVIPGHHCISRGTGSRPPSHSGARTLAGDPSRKPAQRPQVRPGAGASPVSAEQPGRGRTRPRGHR